MTELEDELICKLNALIKDLGANTLKEAHEKAKRVVQMKNSLKWISESEYCENCGWCVVCSNGVVRLTKKAHKALALWEDG